MTRQSLKLVLLCLALTSLVFSQGLNTTASKDDWEEINFEFDSSILTDGFPSLLRLAELLNMNPEYKVQLTGHADYLGSQHYNVQLALKRGNAVKEFLEKYGARDGQITVVSRGEESPKISAQNDEARFMNRRVAMTVRDGDGNIIGAGGVGDIIKAIEALADKQEECCNAILKKLDKLDDILAAINDLKGENAKLRGEIDALKAAQSGLQKEVAAAPKAPPAPSTAQLQEMADRAAERAATRAESQKPSRFSLLGINLGSDDQGGLTFTGKGRYFLPFKKKFAFQAEAEYLRFTGRKEGQLDFGLVGRHKMVQVGLFSSFKNVSLSEYDNTGTLGQASLTADYLFSHGKVGAFGSKGFMDKSLIQTREINANIIENTYLRTVDQVGGSWTLALWGRNWFEGNLGYLHSRVYDGKPGGTMRFVFPFAERWAFTVEGGFNETMIGPSSTGRVVGGIQFGNFIEPKRYAEIDHPVPVDIPRVRYEILTERVRSGNDAPVADAGPDLIGIAAGQINLDGSASFDPDGDPITFQWAQVAGPTVSLAGADTAQASFTAADGEVYGFRLTVSDDQGAKSLDRISISTKDAPTVRILRFEATPDRINRGESSTLNWQVENADEVTISEVGSVDAQTGTTSVSPTETTVYTLTAKNSTSESQATVAVVVETPQPAFLRCQVTPANIVQGETASIAWQTQNATSVTLSGFGGVSLSGSQSVNPMENTTYTLVANNENGSISCPLTVQVTPGEVPRILSFTANPREILAGTSTALFWQVENADEVTISEVGEVNKNSGTQSVSPAETTAYILTAKNEFGEVSTNTVVTVVQPARITRFEAIPAEIEKVGDFFHIVWDTESADEVTISGLGQRPGSGDLPQIFRGEITYTIVASNRYSQDTATLTVKLKEDEGPAPIAPPIANAGEDIETLVRLVWLDASGSVSPAGGPLQYSWRSADGNATVVSPNSMRTEIQLIEQVEFYTIELTVTDEQGQTSTDTVTIHFRGTLQL